MTICETFGHSTAPAHTGAHAGLTSLPPPAIFTVTALLRSHLDAEGEVVRGPVQFAAVHHRVHVQLAQVGHVLQVPRFLLEGKRLNFQQENLHQLRLQQENPTFDEPLVEQ